MYWFFCLLLTLASRPSATYVTFVAKPGNIRLHYAHKGSPIRSLNRLPVIDTGLKFATNASMYEPDYSPVGLYVENGRLLQKPRYLNNPSVNFGMQPQGVFAITKKGKAVIVPVQEAKISSYKYAVQVAPMLVLNGRVNEKLTRSGSAKKRSGYGLLPDGRVLIAISNGSVTFREFAGWFVSQHCTEAVFIDGVVSDYWTPSHPAQERAKFGFLLGAK